MKPVIELMEREQGAACCRPVSPPLTGAAADKFGTAVAAGFQTLT